MPDSSGMRFDQDCAICSGVWPGGRVLQQRRQFAAAKEDQRAGEARMMQGRRRG